ncbi:unnamed protein product [Camellia sinensis]
MQTSMGLSKILILVGAIRSWLKRSLVKGMEKNGESSESDSYVSHAIASQITAILNHVPSVAMTELDLKHMRSGNMTSLIVPAVAVGALCYGCMWWKGLTFSDLMYVTKRNMANAVSNLTKHLESAKKRHLTQRIENLDGKLDEQVEISKLIKNEVTDVRGDLSQIGFDLDALQRIVSSLDGKIYSLEDKQGLKEIVDSFVTRNANRLITDGTMQEGIERLDDRPRTLMRDDFDQVLIQMFCKDHFRHALGGRIIMNV